MRYQELDVIEYIKRAVEHARVIWLGRKGEVTDSHGFVLGKVALIPIDELATMFAVNEIECRKWTINTQAEWQAFTENTYVMACKDGKTWKDLDGEKLKLTDSLSVYTERKGEIDNNIILTVFDEETDDRLIVDGNNRACIITRELNLPGFKPVEIWECYGELVNVIFPCDILQMPSPTSCEAR